MTTLNRRTLITSGAVSVVGAGAVILTGCVATPTSGAGQSESGSPNSDSSPLASGTVITAVASVPVGGSVQVTVDGVELVLAQPTDGTIVAFSAICTHRGCLVEAAKSEFDCPCHGSRFDAATGDVLSGPAQLPLPAVQVTINGANVVAA